MLSKNNSPSAESLILLANKTNKRFQWVEDAFFFCFSEIFYVSKFLKASKIYWTKSNQRWRKMIVWCCHKIFQGASCRHNDGIVTKYISPDDISHLALQGKKTRIYVSFSKHGHEAKLEAHLTSIFFFLLFSSIRFDHLNSRGFYFGSIIIITKYKLHIWETRWLSVSIMC